MFHSNKMNYLFFLNLYIKEIENDILKYNKNKQIKIKGYSGYLIYLSFNFTEKQQ